MTDPALLERLDRLAAALTHQAEAVTLQAQAIDRLVEALAEEELEGDDGERVLDVPRYLDGTPQG